MFSNESIGQENNLVRALTTVLLPLYLGLPPLQSKATLDYLCIKGMNATGLIFK